MRSYANAAGIALIGTVMIRTVLDVAHNTLDMLCTVVAAFVFLHLFVHSSFSFPQELSAFLQGYYYRKKTLYTLFGENVCPYM